MKIAIGISTPSIENLRFKACYEALIKNTKIPYELLIFESRPKTIMEFNYSYAVNTLFRGIPDADYYVVLNGDCFVTPNWLEILLKVFEQDPKIGIVGPSFIGTTGIKYNGGLCKLNEFGTGIVSYEELLTKQRDVLFALGALIVISKECVKKTGGWCEKECLKQGLNDFDFGVRAWENGFRVVCQPAITVIHDNTQLIIEALRKEGVAPEDIGKSVTKLYAPIMEDGYWNSKVMLDALRELEKSNKRYEQ